MPIMEWNSSFELGIAQFDDHHKHLVSLLNSLYDSMIPGANHENLGAILDELIDYATYHFTAEEYWMVLHNYPESPQHCAEHTRFSKRVVEIQKDFYNGKAGLSLEVLQFLGNWLSSHILTTDAEYGRFAAGFRIISFPQVRD